MFIRDGRFSSGSVSEGHPDTPADRISDAAPDAFPRRDTHARVACETLLADGYVVVAGEFHTRDRDIVESVRTSAPDRVRRVLGNAGDRDAATGIDPERCKIEVRFTAQSGDIRRGADRYDGGTGVGDQGISCGYASDETPQLMPAPIVCAHRLMRRQAELRRSGAHSWPGPDARSQVTFRHEDGRPVAIDAIVLSTQHDADSDQTSLEETVRREIIDVAIPSQMRACDARVWIDPTGRFVTDGPKGDTGLTGRMIIVDTFSGAAPHGGGAFSGKDPSRADRSAAYMARFLARETVARGWARRALIQLSYAIGVAAPVSVLASVDAGAGASGPEIVAALQDEFDLTPKGIMDRLDLRRPLYYPTAAYGCFGRDDPDLPWERAGASSTGRIPGDPGDASQRRTA